MTQNKKPGPADASTKKPERDFSKEIQQIGFIPGAPNNPPANKTATPANPTPPANTPPDETTSDILWRLLTRTKPGIFFICLFSLFIVSQVVHLGSFGPRTIILILLIALLVHQIKHEVLIPMREGGKPDKHLIGIILIPTLILGFFEGAFLWKQHVATEVTREISGNPDAWAQCQRFTPALMADSLNAGYYMPSQDKDKAIIQYIYCNEWGNFYYSGRNSIEDMQTLWSVGTVIHEAVHVSGELNEATTQCLTHKIFPHVLREFGVSENKIQEYSAKYATGAKRMPAQYLNGQCENHPLMARVPQMFH